VAAPVKDSEKQTTKEDTKTVATPETAKVETKATPLMTIIGRVLFGFATLSFVIFVGCIYNYRYQVNSLLKNFSTFLFRSESIRLLPLLLHLFALAASSPKFPVEAEAVDMVQLKSAITIPQDISNFNKVFHLLGYENLLFMFL